MSLSTRTLTFDTDKIRARVQAHLQNDSAFERYNVTMSNWQSLGFVASNELEQLKRYQQLSKLKDLRVSKEILDLPHPVRCFDYGGIVDSSSVVFSDAAPLLLSTAYETNSSILDVEQMALQIASNPYLQHQYPQFYKSIVEFGVGGLFTLLCPLFHSMKSDPVFSFTKDTIEEVLSIDIAKGIDTTYLRSPAKSCYFHLKDLEGFAVHDSVTGYHDLEGFYMYEAEDHYYDFDDVTLDALGLDPEKPYRAMSIVFVGKPKETVMNDTLSKIDVFCQDGQSIDDMITRTVRWYMGEVSAHVDCSSLDLGAFVNRAHDASGMNVEHNVRLLRLVVNFVAYLSFASFRQVKEAAREDMTKKVMAKSPTNRPSSAKKIKGKIDQIVIQTSNTYFNRGQSETSGFKKSPHFRRGFIRNQRYGSGEGVYYKPKFIAPTLVAQVSHDLSDIKSKNYLV
ncbi:hypothetical protein [Vibrio vulnificus]|uniref:hypothetical protein n=1 Tax=Vibrio vulnificus TaxID=672 RepID=UPI001A3220D4|nr:hypothetical protein [Vibrio vulnificus]HAS6035750.1 hypothetical protein [Vibrio vulnificus]HDY7428844.1 hypothetical protein [Vibrio vulnificus]HDY7951474.1 hypothetical protein [Vibrio vulnificus]